MVPQVQFYYNDDTQVPKLHIPLFAYGSTHFSPLEHTYLTLFPQIQFDDNDREHCSKQIPDYFDEQ